MNTLAIECCTETCSVAACSVGPGGYEVWWRAVHQAGQQLSLLAPLLAELLAARPGVQWDRVAVSHGPGTFTGLRIGLATARTLAQVWDVPVLALDTLDTVACNTLGYGVFPVNAAVQYRIAQPEGEGDVTVVLDARKGELFAASYQGSVRWPRPVWGPIAMQPSQLTPQLALSGSGLQRYPELPGAARPAAEWWPSAAHLALAAAGAYAGVPEAQPWTDVQAFYLRAPDVKIPAFMQAPT